MKVYAGIVDQVLKKSMNKTSGMLGNMFKEIFTTPKPEIARVKDPDTGAIGNLYTYSCSNDNMVLNAEMYPFPGISSAYLVKCYCSEGEKPDMKTVTILNKKQGKYYKPLLGKEIGKMLKEYVSEYMDVLGDVTNESLVDRDMNQEEDDGFE